jgi:predicted N-acetyltransferase YhbS
MQLEHATAHDIDTVLSLIRDLSNWLKTKSIRQWSAAFPREILEGEVANGELFVVRENEELIASVALTRKAGELWANEEGTALYLSRLIVNRKFSGNDLGQKVMSLAETEARHQGLSLLRLVTDSKNSFLQSYYEKLGYSSKGVRHYAPYNMDFMCYEKRI